MSWIKPEDIHQCDFPTYNHADPHTVGALWRCDEPWCNRIWSVISMTSWAKKDGSGEWNGVYRFKLINYNRYLNNQRTSNAT